jgi:hypothetical protein
VTAHERPERDGEPAGDGSPDADDLPARPEDDDAPVGDTDEHSGDAA